MRIMGVFLHVDWLPFSMKIGSPQWNNNGDASPGYMR